MIKRPYIADFRVAAARYIAYAASFLLVPFAINHFLQGRTMFGVACLMITAIFIINAISNVKGKPHPFLILFGLVPIVITLLAFTFFEQGIVAALWCYPSMMAFYLMLPEKQAWLANVAIFLMATIFGFQVLEPHIAIRVSLTLGIVSVFTAIFIRAITNQLLRLEEQIVTDSLTGLSDRILLSDSLEKASRFGVVNNQPMTLIALDLDHFKLINDDFGHNEGDNVLKAVGELLKSNIRKSDAVFRLGGEEFLALLYKTDLEEAKVIAEKLRLAMESLEILPDRKITSSFGVATFEAGETDKSWMKRADEKLYQAKSLGRNCICS